jgi:predicted nucleotidyltransferase
MGYTWLAAAIEWQATPMTAEAESPREQTKGDAALAEIVRRLVAAYRPDWIYLLGSRAREDGGTNSDYDILVVVGDEAPADRRRSRLAYEVLRGTGVAADVLVWTREAFEARVTLRASLPATVLAEGKLLYAA